MAGETAVETPQQDNTVQEQVKTDKEAIVEEEKAAEQATEEKKDEEKKEEEPAKKSVDPVKPKKPTTHVKDFEEDMVYLFQFTRSPQIPSISPFCLKLESWLKLHGIKYQVGNKYYKKKKGGADKKKSRLFIFLKSIHFLLCFRMRFRVDLEAFLDPILITLGAWAATGSEKAALKKTMFG